MTQSSDADHYSALLAGVARFAVTHKAIVVGVWLGLAVVLALAFPQLETVVRQQSVDPVPRNIPSLQALDRMAKAFGEVGSTTTVVVAMENPDGLTPKVRQRYSVMVDKLRADSGQVKLVRDLLSDPATAGQATSRDGKAWYLPVGIAGTLGSPRAAESVRSVRDVAANAFGGTGTVTKVTGPAATMSDQIVAADDDLLVISVATAALIALILLLVYRTVFTALLPLLVIGLSLAVGRGILAALGEVGVPVSQFTIAFMTVILLGAGTDYSVFLISRYHEQRRQGVACCGRASMMWRGASTGRKIWFRGAEASYQQGGAHTKAVRQRLKPVRRAGAGVSNGAEYEPQIRAAMAELASNFPLQADDVEGTLASVTSAAVELIRGVDHADVLLIDQGRFDSMAATAPIVEELDAIRQRFQEGPCLQAAMNDPVIRCIDLRDEPRFPQFAAAATKLGVYSMLSFQLYIYRRGAGALNLLGGAPRAFAQEAAYRRTAGPSARQRWS